MDWAALLAVSLAYSLGYCVVFTGILFVAGTLAPDAMAHDYPPAIQERHGPKSPRGRRVAAWMSVVMALTFVATPTLAMIHLAARTGGAPGFWEGFVFGVTMMVVLNFFDLFVIDWWLFCTVQPRFLVLPGTEGMPEYADKAFHVKVLVPTPIPWPLLMIPGYGVVVGAATALAAWW